MTKDMLDFSKNKYMLFEFCSKSMYFLDTGMRIHTITYFQIFKIALTFYLLVLKAGI